MTAHTPESIGTTLRRILAEQLGVTEDHFNGGQRLCEDLGADSLDVVELFMAIEDEFGIAITDEEADAAKTVSAIADLIQSKVLS